MILLSPPSLEPSLRMLVQVQTARLNGCAFCQDLILAKALRRKLKRERFDALADHRTSPLFSERERAAHFSETEIVELV